MIGLGRKIRVWANSCVEVWEGQFKYDKLHGFGRYIVINWDDNQASSYIGMWENGQHHGYGLLDDKGHGFHKEGIFENGEYNSSIDPKPEDIIDFNRLLIKKTLNADGSVQMKDGKDEAIKEEEEDSFMEFRQSMIETHGEKVEF